MTDAVQQGGILGLSPVRGRALSAAEVAGWRHYWDGWIICPTCISALHKTPETWTVPANYDRPILHGARCLNCKVPFERPVADLIARMIAEEGTGAGAPVFTSERSLADQILTAVEATYPRPTGLETGLTRVELVPPGSWRTLWFWRMSDPVGLALFFNLSHWAFGVEGGAGTCSILLGPLALSTAVLRSATDGATR
jgi:hypothetical protein